MQTVMYTKEIGRIAKQMGMAYFYITMGESMKDIGKMTYNMVMGLKHGQTATNIKGNTNLGKKTDRVFINGVMVVIIKGIGLIMKLQGTDYMFGVIIEDTRVIGLQIKSMGKEYMIGDQEEHTRVSINKI